MVEKLPVATDFITRDYLDSFIREVCKIMNYNFSDVQVKETDNEYHVIFQKGCEPGKRVLAEKLRKITEF